MEFKLPHSTKAPTEIEQNKKPKIEKQMKEYAEKGFHSHCWNLCLFLSVAYGGRCRLYALYAHSHDSLNLVHILLLSFPSLLLPARRDHTAATEFFADVCIGFTGKFPLVANRWR